MVLTGTAWTYNCPDSLSVQPCRVALGVLVRLPFEYQINGLVLPPGFGYALPTGNGRYSANIRCCVGPVLFRSGFGDCYGVGVVGAGVHGDGVAPDCDAFAFG